jgi:dipeptidyl aminopeptidase/acylaminoacyl peptidase
VAALAAFLACLSSAQAQTGRPLPPVAAFGQLPFITNPELAPDGKHFAAIQAVDGRPAAAIYQVNAPAGSRPHVYGSTKWIVTYVKWIKNDRLVVVTKTSFHLAGDPSFLLRGLYRGVAVGVGDEDPVELFSNPALAQSVAYNVFPLAVSDIDLDDPDAVYMPLWTIPKDMHGDDATAISVGIDPNFHFSLYRVDVHTGHADMVDGGSLLEGVWFMDGHGNVVGRVDRLHEPLVDRLRFFSNGNWRDIHDFDATGDKGADVAGLSADGKSLVIVQRAERDSLATIDLASGSVSGTLFGDGTYDVDDAITDEWTGRVIGASYVADKTEYRYFDPSLEALQKGIEAVFPGKSAVAVSMTRDNSTAIVAVSAPRLPPTYYFLDRVTHQATEIASQYPDLTPDDLGEMKPYPYTARDGLAIPAYLTIPPGRDAKSLPLVVMPHGGPDARDSIGFDWWAQFLANRGYAVFQPNYRGSSGYGQAFTNAGLHQWGLKMQDDITDGVKKLIADGVADPKRICIVGASYGGYAALAGATFTPDLYACAVSFAGVSDLPAMLARARSENGRNSKSLSFWTSRIGDASDDAARLDATSPAMHADRVKIPILLMHGVNDTTVPIEQSEEERDALQRAGKNVQFVQFDGDDHYLSLAETRIQMLSTLEAFLKNNIGG